MDDIIQDIRKQCRMAMNGIASTSMRKQGLTYKLNFGVPILEIRNIASKYTPDKKLAEALWIEDTRELKILATLLYPIELFTQDDAQRWARQIPNQEIREQITLNLFQKLPFADVIAKEWANSQDANLRTTGYWLLARILILNKGTLIVDIESITDLYDDLVMQNVSLRNASILLLKNIGKSSKDISAKIINKIASFEKSEDPLLQEIYDTLSFEFDYLYNQRQ